MAKDRITFFVNAVTACRNAVPFGSVFSTFVWQLVDCMFPLYSHECCLYCKLVFEYAIFVFILLLPMRSPVALNKPYLFAVGSRIGLRDDVDSRSLTRIGSKRGF